ncbi:putative membrane protein [Escherichia coli MP020980.2]|nr:putative membrane protein [Escherichia coli MP020980.2]
MFLFSSFVLFLDSVKYQIYFSLRLGVVIFNVFVGFCPLIGSIFG